MKKTAENFDKIFSNKSKPQRSLLNNPIPPANRHRILSKPIRKNFPELIHPNLYKNKLFSNLKNT